MRDHTSLLAWQASREVVIGVFRLAKARWHPVSGPILSQLQRAALSVQLNIAEGHALGTSASFRRHLRIAYGSAVETAELLRLLVDLKLVPDSEVSGLAHENVRSQQLTLGLLRRSRTP